MFQNRLQFNLIFNYYALMHVVYFRKSETNYSFLSSLVTNWPLSAFVLTQPQTLNPRLSNQFWRRGLVTSGVKSFKQAPNLHILTDTLIPVFSFNILLA